MTLEDFVADIPGFSSKSGSAKIEFFAWYCHEFRGKERVTTAELTSCFDEVHEPRLSNIGVFLKSLTDRKPARMLKDGKGYRLAGAVRAELGAKFQIRPRALKTTGLLDGLASRVTDPAQKVFLAEALVCYKSEAYRAAIVMAWNLAYSHLLDFILNDPAQLAKFNGQRARAFPKEKEVTKRSDFEDYKESRVIEIARGGDVISASSSKILKAKLDIRNTAAHPSVVVVRDVTAEEVIHDLVENIIVKATL